MAVGQLSAKSTTWLSTGHKTIAKLLQNQAVCHSQLPGGVAIYWQMAITDVRMVGSLLDTIFLKNVQIDNPGAGRVAKIEVGG